MRTVELQARVAARPFESVFWAIADGARYKDHTDTVIDVEVEQLGIGHTRSAWTVRFRDGILKYVSEESADPAAGEIRFQAIDGDFEEFAGLWTVSCQNGTTLVNLKATFDSGLGTLSEMVDPIAEKTLRDNFQAILTGLVGEDVEFER